MPRNLNTVARRRKVLRTLVGDSTVDTALREVYDRLDELQPEIVAHQSPLISREVPVGTTMLAKNNITIVIRISLFITYNVFLICLFCALEGLLFFFTFFVPSSFGLSKSRTSLFHSSFDA